MEFYDPNNDNYNPLSDGKKKAKKKPGKDAAWPNYPIVESPNGIEENHVPNLFTVPGKNKDKASKVFFPEQHSGAQDTQKELSEEQVREQFGEIAKGLPDLDQKYPPAETAWPQDSANIVKPNEYGSDDVNQQPAQRTYEESLKDYSQKPEANSVIYNNQAEPVRRVSGYSREEGEYYSGYLPGAPESIPDMNIPEGGGNDRGGGNLPPAPPHESGAAMPEDVPPSARTTGTTNNMIGNLSSVKSYEDDVHSAESKGMRRGFVAGAIVAWVVGRHLKNLKLKRERTEFNKEIGRHQEQIDALQAEKVQQRQNETEHERQMNQYEADQRKLKEQLDQKLSDAHFKPTAESRPPVVYKPEHEPLKEKAEPAPLLVKPASRENSLKQSSEKGSESHKQQEMIDAALRDIEKAVEDADKKRIEQDAWLRHELDEHGHEIQGQRRGQEYDHERAQELLQHQQQQSDHKAGAEPVFVGQAAQYHHSSIPQRELGSGQVPMDHRLPYDSHNPLGYPLTGKKQHNPLVGALTSPWTFLMLSIILLAYFIATLL